MKAIIMVDKFIHCMVQSIRYPCECRVVGWGSGWQSHTWCRHQMELFSALLAFVRGIHRSPVNSPNKGQWRVALMFSMMYAWIYGRVNIHGAGDLRRHHAHSDVTVMNRSQVIRLYQNWAPVSHHLLQKVFMNFWFCYIYPETFS